VSCEDACGDIRAQLESVRRLAAGEAECETGAIRLPCPPDGITLVRTAIEESP